MNCGIFVQISDALMLVESVGDGNVTKFVSSASKLKVKVENGISFVSAALFKAIEKKTCDDEDGNLLVEANCMLDELKQLSSALDMSERELEENISTIAQLLESLHLRRPRLETFLNQLFVLNNTNADEKEAHHSNAEETSNNSEEETSNNVEEETSNSDNGKALQVTGDSSGTKNNGNGGDAESNKGKGNSKSKKGKKGNNKSKKVIQQQSSYNTEQHGDQLVGILHEIGSKELVILCHGFRSSKDCILMVILAVVLGKARISAFRFDFAGNR
ncbi:hypothetical protein ACSBR2_039273 [Camellia fascicularis]